MGHGGVLLIIGAVMVLFNEPLKKAAPSLAGLF
jgi:hypothetical protein